MKLQNLIYFLTLVVILVLGASSFWLLQGNQSMQLIIGIITSICYVSWGIFYHYIKNDLYPKVVIEYLLFGLIAGIILFSVLR
jgi:hypothetical protein